MMLNDHNSFGAEALSALPRSAVAFMFCAVVSLTTVAVAEEDVIFTDSEIQRILGFGPWPGTVPNDPGNEFSDSALAQAIGKKLFDDPALSLTGDVSCRSCHEPTLAYTDGLTVAEGVDGKLHIRNTQGLADSGLQRWWGWDGGVDSQWAAALRPLLSPVEMANTIESLAGYLRDHVEYDSALKQLALKGADSKSTAKNPDSADAADDLSDEQLVVRAAKYMAAFTRTIRSLPTPFDAYRTALEEGDTATQDKYPLSAKRGLKIFLGEANCHVCHLGPNFSNGEFHDTGRPFFVGVGQVDSGRYSGIQRVRAHPYSLLGEYNGTHREDEKRKTRSVRLGQANWGQWRTPSLRNLTYTAPYMHDGSLESLDDVVESYVNIDTDRLHTEGESILKPLDLTAADKDALVCFLESLSSLTLVSALSDEQKSSESPQNSAAFVCASE